MKVPYARIDCSGNEAKYIAEVLDSGWLTTASKAKDLEDRISQYIGADFCLAVNSCTSAMHLALDALGVERGAKVFVPSLTFTATAEVVRYLGAHPVLLDVDLSTNAISTDILKEAIEQHPDVETLIVVHFGGLAAPMTVSDGEGILDICNNSGIKIVEDAAHALPAQTNDAFVGTFGDITCFSFYANKTMTTGEGGMVSTNNPVYATRMKQMRLHGIDRDVWNRFTSDSNSWEYDVIAPGFKYNMADLNAAVGLAQFERLEAMHDRRVACARWYFEALASATNLQLPHQPDVLASHAWHLYPIRLNDRCNKSRNELIESLAQRGIGTSVHYKPIHRLTYYAEKYGLDAVDFPNSEKIWQTSLSLPIYNLLSDEDLEFVCANLIELTA